ncbi:SEC-C metal-binding domain-containing protein [Rossellomorea vietnamensis]|uniref:YecA family protein n=1 Tax=Rossellomorea vietnamensis TaxID=218284 RepID=UPI003D265EBA
MKKTDKKTRDALLRGLQGMMEMQRKMDEKRAHEIWKNIDPGATLIEVLNTLKKDEVDSIRKAYEFQGMSALKKADMALEVSMLVPHSFQKMLHRLDQERYDLLKRVVQSDGFLMVDQDFSTRKLKSLMTGCLVFGSCHNGQRALVVPQELQDCFRKLDGPDLRKIIKRNTEWIMLTNGLHYYYGVMRSKVRIDTMERLVSDPLDIHEYSSVIHESMDYYKRISFSSAYGYKDTRVMYEEKLEKRNQTDYYPFTKKQLMEAGKENHFDATPEMIEFLAFIDYFYDMEDERLIEIAKKVITMINQEHSLEYVLDYLQSFLEIPSKEVFEQLTDCLINVWNNTRIWVLKGYTPIEIRLKAENKQPVNVMNQAAPSKEEDLNSKKTGRNDACPCGSGKKYKHCCGRK